MRQGNLTSEHHPELVSCHKRLVLPRALNNRRRRQKRSIHGQLCLDISQSEVAAGVADQYLDDCQISSGSVPHPHTIMTSESPMTNGLNENSRWQPLPRAEVIKAVERERPMRIPLAFARWWGEGLVDQYGERLQQLEKYPEDAVLTLIDPIRYDDMGLSWPLHTGRAKDSDFVLRDWADLDEFLAKLPDPEHDERFAEWQAQADAAHASDRYYLFGWWLFLFERAWQIRGMENLLTDYYLYPDEVHRLHGALCDLYIRYLQRAERELHPDGFWTSDDLGHQQQLMMQPALFRQILKPYYARIGTFLKENNLHWWLHSCGNNTAILGDLAETGVDVFHPVQKGTMDEQAVARDYGDRLTILAGIDVQHVLQECSPAGVRAEVRFLIDTFDRAEGGMCIAAGNGIVAGTPLENIDAFLDEALRYGIKHRGARDGLL